MYVNNFFSCLEKTNLNMWCHETSRNFILPFLIVNYIEIRSFTLQKKYKIDSILHSDYI